MRLSEGRTRSFQAPATIRKFASSQVYLFRSGQSDSDDSEEELDVMELRARGKEQQRCTASQEKVGDVVVLEREVAEHDSLNKLALQYGCKVADIKRVNNFMREQDLYALKSIKIPVKVNSILMETNKELLAPSHAPAPLLTEWSEGENRSNSSSDHKQIDQYFRGIDQNIEQAVQVEVSLKTDYAVETPNRLPPGRKDPRGGADWGIQWWNAVVVMLLVGIVLPVFYIVYFKTQDLGVAPGNTTFLANDSSLQTSATGARLPTAATENTPTTHSPRTQAWIPSGG
ncbi:lysM and putative peptidoglycan-binding domain-containing protein 4 isoform X2 [Hemicordylus capensis]|nr:lysM and putative peptidoglycan-binding domain-containing protein 4 isoform X2 [Hemicordylus capensis]XP_053128217.1 lysM and putative peptidoglycan-binding domain-containing protein 4 isoform X2 [Hemicordylus capensis]XP_053128218.1 lysM and putative peptidoglycan-binding domain-containing protein 4 isoform X2 [Hemicordylus capensis]